MSKGLDTLKTIRHIDEMEHGKDKSMNNAFDIIEKELKALEIIKNKKVACLLIWLMERHTKECALRLYNEPCDENRKLTKEEYDLLKEVLLWTKI